MKNKFKSLGILLLAILVCVSGLIPRTNASEVLAGEIPVTVALSGTLPAAPEVFTIVLKADGEEAPMPDGSQQGVYRLTVTGADTVRLPGIPFERVGIYTYTITQEAGTDPHCTYDSTVYQLRIAVTNARDGGLETAAIISPANSNEKLDAVLFRNAYETVQPSDPEYRDLTVVKEWSDNGKNRPSSVTVQLVDGDKVVETVTLSQQNQWTYTWKQLEYSQGHNWYVREINIPRNYTASYSNKGNTVVIRNTESLIRTGQLNWPIPVLTGTGLGLLAVGGLMLKSKRKEDHA